MQSIYSLVAVLAFTASCSAAYADTVDVTSNKQTAAEKAAAAADKLIRSIASAPKNPQPGENLQQYGIRQVEAAMAMQNALSQQQAQQNLQKQQKIRNMIQQVQASGGQH